MKSILIDNSVKIKKDINDIRFVLISDLHDFNKISMLKSKIASVQPDIILICGDIMASSKYFKDESFDTLKKMLATLSEIAPVVITPGNHDIFLKNDEWEEQFKKLEEGNDRVYALCNDEVELLGKVKIYGFCPSHEIFKPAYQDGGLAFEQVVEGWEKFSKKITIEDDKLNVLMMHNPFNFQQAINLSSSYRFGYNLEFTKKAFEVASSLSKFDLVPSAHLHGGYIPVRIALKHPKIKDKGVWEMPIERDRKGHIRFVRPWIYKATNLSRGTAFVGKCDEYVLKMPKLFGSKEEAKYYLCRDGKYDEISEYTANFIIEEKELVPISLSGGIKPYFNEKIGTAEIDIIDVSGKKEEDLLTNDQGIRRIS